MPASRKLIADLLRVTPVLRTTPDGRVSSAGILPGRKNPLQRFARYVARHAPAASELRLGIAHAQRPRDAEHLRSLLIEAIPNAVETSITELGSVVGAHAGPGALVVGMQRRFEIDDYASSDPRSSADTDA